jgi:hypothetical protein
LRAVFRAPDIPGLAVSCRIEAVNFAHAGEYSRIPIAPDPDNLVALALRPQKQSSLSDKIVGVLKEAADQCSGLQHSLIWLHLIGHAEAEFLQVANFSQQGQGAGLNAIVSKVLHPCASKTDRSHVQTIRFSAEAAEITQRPILDRERLIRRARSLSGPCYDVPNPFCRFKGVIDF